jgi:hypothetical protein
MESIKPLTEIMEEVHIEIDKALFQKLDYLIERVTNDNTITQDAKSLLMQRIICVKNLIIHYQIKNEKENNIKEEQK